MPDPKPPAAAADTQPQGPVAPSAGPSPSPAHTPTEGLPPVAERPLPPVVLPEQSSNIRPVTEQLAPDVGYDVGQWGGMPNYICRRCEFPTVGLDIILDHVEEHLRQERAESAQQEARAAQAGIVVARQ